MNETINFGTITLEFLHSKETTAGSLDLFRMTVQPHGRVPVPHYHENWDEAVYGLAGTLHFTVDGETLPIGPGETLFIKRGVVHGFNNVTKEPAACLCVLTPGVLGPGYFREMAALLASGAADPPRIKEIMLRHGLVPLPPKT